MVAQPGKAVAEGTGTDRLVFEDCILRQCLLSLGITEPWEWQSLPIRKAPKYYIIRKYKTWERWSVHSIEASRPICPRHRPWSSLLPLQKCLYLGASQLDTDNGFASGDSAFSLADEARSRFSLYWWFFKSSLQLLCNPKLMRVVSEGAKSKGRKWAACALVGSLGRLPCRRPPCQQCSEAKWQHEVFGQRGTGLAPPDFHQHLFDLEDIQKFPSALYEGKREVVIWGKEIWTDFFAYLRCNA